MIFKLEEKMEEKLKKYENDLLHYIEAEKRKKDFFD